MTIHARPPRRRGQPLFALALLLLGWTAARFALWESPFARAVSASVAKAVAEAPAIVEPSVVAPSPSAGVDIGLNARKPAPATIRSVGLKSHLVLIRSRPPKAQEFVGTSVGARSPATVMPFDVQPAPVPLPLPLAKRRFHVASWAAWRQGSGLPQLANGALPPTYGGSQAGFLAQYDLGRGPRRPALHVRATYAPDRPQQAEMAAGIGARPIAALPVRVLAEARVTHVEGRTKVRPALFAVTELAPVSLPHGLRAEGYAQGGWVGGHYATAFADAQARVTHGAATVGPARLRIGAGAWGGAQKFAERLDVGPTLTADIAPIRLTLDYRMRVAGNARPGNGLALTLSTGF